MKPYVCKHHGPQEPYIYDRSHRGMCPLRLCPVCRKEHGSRRSKTPEGKAYFAEWYVKNREKRLEQGRETVRHKKQQIIAGYGGKCSCCGETEPEFLTIDHIDGDGAAKRKSGADAGPAFYNRLIAEGFPKDRYRLLCMNCNFALGKYGHCPHKRLQLVKAS